MDETHPARIIQTQRQHQARLAVETELALLELMRHLKLPGVDVYLVEEGYLPRARGRISSDL